MKIRKWFRKLVGSLIQGGGHGGSAYLGLLVAHEAYDKIPALNVEGLGVVIVTSALLKFFQFLDTNPLPEDDEEPPRDKFTSAGGLALLFIIILTTSGCSTLEYQKSIEDHTAAQWINERKGFIENAVAALTQISVYSTQSDTYERERTIQILRAIAGNLNALVNAGIADVDQIRDALKIEEPYFGILMNAVFNVIRLETNTFKENGYGDLTIEIIDAVSKGIMDGVAE